MAENRSRERTTRIRLIAVLVVLAIAAVVVAGYFSNHKIEIVLPPTAEFHRSGSAARTVVPFE